MESSGTNNSIREHLSALGYEPIPLLSSGVGHLEADARINGRRARLIVDTGASATVLDRQSADRLGLSTASTSEQAAGCPGGEPAAGFSVGVTTVDEIRLHSFVAHGVTARVLDLSTVNRQLETGGGGRIDGIIGADLLDAHQAIIAYAQRELYLLTRERGPQRAPGGAR